MMKLLLPHDNLVMTLITKLWWNWQIA